jgi:large repetitive protein
MAAAKEKKRKEMNPWRSLLTQAVWLYPFLAGVLQLNAQIITSMDPPLGAPGERIVLTGSGFAAGAKVTFFNGVQDTTAAAASTTTIYAHVPAGARTGPITVQVGANSATSVADFTVVGFGPYISDLVPAYGSVNEDIVILGWHLTNATSVKFAGGKNSLAFMPNANGSQITARVPSGATNGPITVTTTYGTSNSPISFTVIGAGPYVTGFFPAVGTPGTPVSIFGAHLINATSVTFAGKPAAIDPNQAPTDVLIGYIVPSGVVSGPIKVSTPAGSFTTATNFFVPPQVTGFSPSTGRAGTNINIRGTNLLGATSVKLGGAAWAVSAATNNTNLVFTIPAGVRSGPIVVVTPAGQTLPTTSNFTFQPLITGFTPAGGPAGTVVTVSGANLDEVVGTNQPTVKFNGASTTVTGATFGQLSATVPAKTETGPLTVTTTNGSFTTVSNFFLPPVLTGISTSNGIAGSKVALHGTNLLGTLHVQFSGIEAAFTDPTNNYVLVATVPTNVTTGAIRVTTPAGFAESSNYFYGAAAITGFTPTHGVPGTLVNISGTNFTGLLAVKFNGLQASDVTVTNDGFTIFALVPTNATTGKISVSTPGGTVTSTNNFIVDLQSGLSVSIQASPTEVFSGSNVVYQIIVVNAGPLDALNTIVHNLLPDSATLISHTNSQGTVQFSGRQLTAALGTLGAQKVATLSLTAKVQGTGTQVDTVSVGSDYPDPNMSDNTNSASVFVLPLPLLSIGKYSDSLWKIAWPALLTNYSLQFNNTMGASANWSNLNTEPTVDAANKFVIEPNTVPSRFYRLKD